MSIPKSGPEKAKYIAALKAMEYVKPGMKLGLGTGSTAYHFVNLIGEAVARGEDYLCVPTSSQTKAQANGLNIPLTTLDEVGHLDVVIDGADEFDPDLNLIKGGGGALLQEKLVACSAADMIVISDDSKEVSTLGRFPLPVEVVQFGWESTQHRIAMLLKDADVHGHAITRRMDGETPFITDEGHYIFDLHLIKIANAPGLADELKKLVGVVETGLFIDIAKKVIVGNADGTSKVIG